MPEQVRSVSRYLGAMAVLLGMILAIAPPAIWFAFARGSLRAHLRQEAESCARMVTEQVAGNPLFWQYDEVRLNYALGRPAAFPGRRAPRRLRCAGEGGGSPERNPFPAGRVGIRHRVGRREAGRPGGGEPPPCGPLGDAAWIGVLSASASAGILFLFCCTRWPPSGSAGLPRGAEGELPGDVPVDRGRGDFDRGGREGAPDEPRGRIRHGTVAGGGRRQGTAEILPLQNDAGEPLSPWALPPGKPAVLASPSGARRTVDVSRVSILSRGTTSVRAVVVVRDVTDRKRMEEEIVRGQRLESLGLLAGGIAHDFNNLLTGVLGNISLAKEMVSPGQREYRRLEEAEKDRRQGEGLSGRLLSFSRDGSRTAGRFPSTK